LRQLVLDCHNSTLQICSVSNAQLIKVIHPNNGGGMFACVGIAANGHQVTCVEHGVDPNQMSHRVDLWDIHGDGSAFEEVRVCQVRERVSEVADSPLDDSIAIMTRPGVIKLAHHRARDLRVFSLTVEVVADGKCFHKPGKCLSPPAIDCLRQQVQTEGSKFGTCQTF
jgi:hypothetical protein